MAHSLNIISIWICEKSAVVMFVIDRTWPRRTQVFATGRHPGPVKLRNRISILGRKRDVPRSRRFEDLNNPKNRPTIRPESACPAPGEVGVRIDD
jgi:hypothetical protein